MARPGIWETVVIGIFSIVMGFVAFAFTESIFNIFFVAIIIIILWDYSTRLNDMQKRLSEMESKLSKETAKTSGAS
jgi:Ca2+-dependent lipid-binding protein